MRRILFVVTLLFFLSFSPVLAQEQTTNLDTDFPEAVRNYCLSWSQLGEENEHNVKLTGSGLQPSAPFELWRSIDNEWVCAVNANGTPACQSQQGEEIKTVGTDFQIKNDVELVTDANGNINIPLVHSYSEQKKNHYFFAFQEYSVRQTAVGDNPGNKLAQIQVTTGSSDICTAVYWDPEGTVFNALTLDPVSGASVSLLRENLSLYPAGPQVRQNPFSTGEDGHFFFYVEDGTYFLKIKKDNPQYRFPLNAQELNTLTARLVQSNMYYNLYTGDAIVQQGKLEHRDIPLMPANASVSQSVRPRILSATVLRQPNGTQSIQGTATHPLVTVEVYVGVAKVGSAVANAFGVFAVDVAKDKIDPLRALEVVAIKPKEIYGQSERSTPVLLYPIPAFIEGYVQINKKVQPNAQVRVAIPSFSNRTLLTAQADEKGFIKIPSPLLPQTEFTLAISDRQDIPLSTMTTASFAQTNSQYMKEEGVNLFDTGTATSDTPDSAIRPVGSSFQPFPSPRPSPTSSTNTNEQSRNDQELITRAVQFIGTLVLLALIAGAIIYLRKLKKPIE